jgi:hypothetical protein
MKRWIIAAAVALTGLVAAGCKGQDGAEKPAAEGKETAAA